MDKKKETAHLNEDDAYLARINAVKEKKTPLGGAPMPVLRPLDDYKVVDPRFAGVQGGTAVGPTTMLTNEQVAELQRRGKYVPGAGSQYALNQPYAHEVMNMVQAPQNVPPSPPRPDQPPADPSTYQNPPRPPGSGLTEKTVEGLVELAKVNAQENQAAQQEKKREMTDEEFKAEVDKLTSEVDLEALNQRTRNVLELPERRRRIEARCLPMSLGDLIIHSEIRQTVPIVPGEYEPTFRTVSGSEDLEIKQLIGLEARTHEGDAYIVDKFSLMNLVASLFSLNSRVFPTHLDKDGDWSKEAFLVKYKLVMKYPIVLLGDLSVNYVWFNERVAKLLAKGDLKDF